MEKTRCKREERLLSFYDVTGKEEVKAHAILICTALDDVFADPALEYYDVEPALTGLPVSILTRPVLLYNEATPALNGALLRVAIKELTRSYIFNPDTTIQIKTLLKA
jgi:hypothetical protein